IDEVLYACATSLGLVIHNDPFPGTAVLLELGCIDRDGKLAPDPMSRIFSARAGADDIAAAIKRTETKAVFTKALFFISKPPSR
ncbi:MAG: hypothetical protein ACREX9_18570, partial [Gammaproteobacteria bacterium]